MEKIIFDLDDFCDEHNILPKLMELKKEIPKLKVNLFTIPQKTSQELLHEVGKNDWLSLIPHGFKHNDNYECAGMSYRKATEKLKKITFPYVKGFKAPGWQISKEVMRALKEWDWWVAVQFADGRLNGHPDGPHQPKVIADLKYYSLNELPEGFMAVHGHCWNTCNNGLDVLIPKLLEYKDREFLFIEEFLYEKNKGEKEN